MTTANLALADNETVIQYTSTGESEFAFPFPILASDELKVSVDQAVKTLGAHYTVDGLGDAGGGTVTFNTPTTAGQRVTLWLEMPIKRLTGFSLGAATLLPQALNTEFIRQVRIDQMLRRDIGRALRVPVDDPEAGQDLNLPTASARAGKYLRFNAVTGNPEVAEELVPGTTLSRSIIGEYLHPQTPEEDAIGLVPSDITIPSHQTGGVINVFRYMTAAQQRNVVTRAWTLDVSGAIQSAIELARTLIESLGGATVFLPQGTYRIETPIEVPHNNPDLGGMEIVGAGKRTTILKSFGITDKVLILGDLTQQQIRGALRDFCVDGNDEADYCIYGPRVEEHDFVRVWARKANVFGMSIGYGYVNNYHQVECSYNAGGGLEFNTAFGGANNANVLSQCLLFSNGGLGLKAQAGHGLWIVDCTIEQNKQGGLLLATLSAVYIRAYFEGNGLDGYTFVTPAQTVKADIIFAGSGPTVMSSAFPVTGAIVEGCITDPRATSDAFIWNGGVADLTVRNCTTNQPTYVPVVAENYTPAEKGPGLIIESCPTFNSQLEVLNVSANINNTNAARVRIHGAPASTTVTNEIERRNYALVDMNQWAVIAGGASTTYRRSQTAGKKKFRGGDVWEIVKAATGTGDQLGFTLDATEYPDLAGKLMWYGIWVNQAAADNYIQPTCSEQGFNNNPNATVGTWTLLGVSFVWPASGTVTLGILSRGAASSGSSYIAAPMLAQVGVPADEVVGLNTKNPRQWMGSAAPTAGAWERGDIVWNTAPSAAGAPGWSCTTAGSPGTWKAMANLAA